MVHSGGYVVHLGQRKSDRRSVPRIIILGFAVDSPVCTLVFVSPTSEPASSLLLASSHLLSARRSGQREGWLSRL